MFRLKPMDLERLCSHELKLVATEKSRMFHVKGQKFVLKASTFVLREPNFML
jgi:hypothetical protein